jgi:methyl-accepting chemotaxis protein
MELLMKTKIKLFKKVYNSKIFKLFNNSSIKRKIMTIVAFMCCSIFLIGTIGILNMNSINNNSKLIYDSNFKSMAYLNEIEHSLSEIGSQLAGHILSKRSGEKVMHEVYIKAYQKQVENDFIKFKAMKLNSKQIKLVKLYESTYVQYKKSIKQVESASKNEDIDKAGMLYDTYITPSSQQFMSIADNLKKINDEGQKELLQSGQNSYTVSIFSVVIVILISLILGVFLSLVIVKQIIDSVDRAQKFASEAANGNLAYKITEYKEDEIGSLCKYLNKSGDQICELLSEAKEVAEIVSVVSKDVNVNTYHNQKTFELVLDTVRQLAKGNNNQAGNLKDLVRKMDSAGGIVTCAAEQTGSIEKSSSAASSLAVVGQKQLNDVINQMEVINFTMNTAVGEIKKLNETSKNINGLVSTISDVAMQTKILSLNASIVAAHAGEYGNGFAVVAEEIQRLSEVSNGSTKNIVELLEEIQTETVEIVKVIEKARNEIEIQSNSITDTSNSLSQVVDGVLKGEEEAKNINKFNNELLTIFDDISSYVRSISTVMQETATASEDIVVSTNMQLERTEELTQNSKKLYGYSIKLNENINKFKLH